MLDDTFCPSTSDSLKVTGDCATLSHSNSIDANTDLQLTTVNNVRVLDHKSEESTRDEQFCERSRGSGTIFRNKVVKQLPPISQILYLTQLSVIVILDTFCLLKLSFLRLKSKAPGCEESDQQLCLDTSLYMSFLSSTLGYLIPPPRLPENIDDKNLSATSCKTADINRQSKRLELSESEIQSHSKDLDFADGTLVEVITSHPTYTEGSHSKQATTDQQWIFFNYIVGREFFIFFSQIILVFILVIFSVARLLFVKSLSCEEKTAYFMILSTCIAYLLPNADSFYKPLK